MENNLLWIFLLVPAAITILNIILPVAVRKYLNLAGLVFMLIPVYMLYQGNPGSINILDYTVFAADKIAIFALTFIQILSFIIFLFCLKGVDKSVEGPFMTLYPLTVAFCNGVVISENMIAFLIFWGLSGLTVYLYGILGKTHEAPGTAKKTFIILGGSDALLIFGFVLIWYLLQRSTMDISLMQLPLVSTASYVAFFLLLIAALAKAGGFPFHTWVPDFTRDAPVESAAFLPASLDKLLGIYLLARMMNSLFTFDFLINMIVVTIGTLTVITAVMMAMEQHNGKKLLGYHAVSQVGYMIMGVGSANPIAFAGGLFHLINHTIYKSNLFLAMGSVEKQTKTAELDYLGGLGSRMPLTFLMALIGALSISGIPPFNGFFSKWMIYQGLIEQVALIGTGYKIWLLICLILAVFGSALTLASFMKFIHATFLGKRPAIWNEIKEAPANQWISTGMLALLCVVFGIFALELPLGLTIIPALGDAGIILPDFTGLYAPKVITIMMAITALLAILVYRLVRKTRYDNVYLGGMEADDKFRIAGTSFYNEIRQMNPLKYIYSMAEKKYFDLYEAGSKTTFAISRVIQGAHPGQLQLYLLYILLGLLIFLIII